MSDVVPPDDTQGFERMDTGGRAVRRWPHRPWYQSTYGIGILLTDVLLTLVFVSLTVAQVEQLPFPIPGVELAGGQSTDIPLIPPFVYVFSVLGALGFVFTALIDDFRATAMELIKYNLRVPASLPLGVGIFLFSGTLLGDVEESGALVVGLVFLSGLYVNLAYTQLGAIAKRFLPDVAERDDEGGTDGDEHARENADGATDVRDEHSPDDAENTPENGDDGSRDHTENGDDGSKDHTENGDDGSKDHTENGDDGSRDHTENGDDGSRDHTENGDDEPPEETGESTDEGPSSDSGSGDGRPVPERS